MKFLSKNMLAVLPALFLGVALHGAAASQENNGSYQAILQASPFYLACKFVYGQTQQNCCGYQVTVPSKGEFTFEQDKGGSIKTGGVSCEKMVAKLERSRESMRDFLCKPPTTKVLYETSTVRVIKKPRESDGTNVLIVPKEHYRNVHALFEKRRAAVLLEIDNVAQIMANHLVEPGTTYTLMTNVGDDRQTAYHAHVHFTSASKLNEDSLQAVSPIKSSMSTAVAHTSNDARGIIQIAQTSRPKSPMISYCMMWIGGFALVGAVATAAYYFWWNKR